MNLKINHITLENFRCFEKLETDLWKETVIKGDNETGKSTIASAILWCLTGKDVDGSSNFEIVPSDKYGKVSPFVELECSLDEKPISFKREYKAKYKRDKSFSEYVTVSYINGIEYGVKKFDKYISEKICEEKIFKILSNPYTFIENCPKENKELVWQAQRKLLMGLVDSEDDMSIAKSNEDFESLIEPLNRYDNIAQYASFLKQEVSRVSKEVASFESKLEQQEKNVIEVSCTKEEAKNNIKRIMSALDDLEKRNNEYKETMGNERNLFIKSEIEKLKLERANLIAGYNQRLEEYQSALSDVKEQYTEALQKAKGYIAKQARYAEEVEKIKSTPIESTCPTCHRPLAKQTIDELEKTKRDRIAKGNAYIEKARSLAETEKKKSDSFATKAEEIKMPVYPAEEKKIQDDIENLINELAKFQKVSDIEGYVETKNNLNSELEKADEILYDIKHNEECEAEIVELEKEYRENNLKLDHLAMCLDTCKEFVSFKCESNEAKINSLFPTVKFQLFEKNKSNDEIREVCNMTFNGHSYEDLSASTKLVANLELLNAFQKHYGVYIPIIIDNCESITADITDDAQIIKMYVSEETCPECGCKSGRRNTNGLWKCNKCGHEWAKKIEIKEN